MKSAVPHRTCVGPKNAQFHISKAKRRREKERERLQIYQYFEYAFFMCVCPSCKHVFSLCRSDSFEVLVPRAPYSPECWIIDFTIDLLAGWNLAYGVSVWATCDSLRFVHCYAITADTTSIIAPDTAFIGRNPRVLIAMVCAGSLHMPLCIEIYLFYGFL